MRMKGGRPSVAVVDDDESVRTALQRLLRSARFDVEAFPSGAEFLHSVKTRLPDCLVLDLYMPGVDGFAVQARLMEAGLRVPTVVITNYDTPETRARLLATGGPACLRKPVDAQTLLDAIADAIVSPSAGDTPPAENGADQGEPR